VAVNLEIDDRERDILLSSLALSFASPCDTETRHEILDLTKRVARLEPEPEPDVPLMDVSSNVWYCPACGVHAPSTEFEHGPGCAWVKRYG
jgi:hypothetical protein